MDRIVIYLLWWFCEGCIAEGKIQLSARGMVTLTVMGLLAMYFLIK